jgi:hypothetical protein
MKCENCNIEMVEMLELPEHYKKISSTFNVFECPECKQRINIFCPFIPINFIKLDIEV